tara:strand:- start:989 stop:1225 length:237 start_codon:yes stop_codon:yes gene_type:complete
VCLSTGRDLTELVRPPRSLFINFPMGNAFGKPFDNAMQRGVLQSCLDMVIDCEVPGELRDLPHEWDVTFGYAPGKSGM